MVLVRIHNNCVNAPTCLYQYYQRVLNPPELMILVHAYNYCLDAFLPIIAELSEILPNLRFWCMFTIIVYHFASLPYCWSGLNLSKPMILAHMYNYFKNASLGLVKCTEPSKTHDPSTYITFDRCAVQSSQMQNQIQKIT